MIVNPGFFRTELLTPRNRRSTPSSTVDDYGERRAQQEAFWTGANGKQGGDPAKLAQALITLDQELNCRAAFWPAPTRSPRPSRRSPRCRSRSTPTANCRARWRSTSRVRRRHGHPDFSMRCHRKARASALTIALSTREHHLGQRALLAQTGRTSESKRSGQKSASILTSGGRPHLQSILDAEVAGGDAAALRRAGSTAPATCRRCPASIPTTARRSSATDRRAASSSWRAGACRRRRSTSPARRSIAASPTSGRRRSSHWRAWLGPEHRCLVPFTSFAENETLPDGIAAAGLVRLRREPAARLLRRHLGDLDLGAEGEGGAR